MPLPEDGASCEQTAEVIREVKRAVARAEEKRVEHDASEEESEQIHIDTTQNEDAATGVEQSDERR